MMLRLSIVIIFSHSIGKDLSAYNQSTLVLHLGQFPWRSMF